MSKKHICIECGNLAVWYYLPGDSLNKEENDYFCDECVPRGCSCNNESIYYDKLDNMEFIEKLHEELIETINNSSLEYIAKEYKSKSQKTLVKTISDFNEVKKIVNVLPLEKITKYSFIPLDDKRREFPCCEFMFDENGFEK